MTVTAAPAPDDIRFARLDAAERIWAVGAIHGDAPRLQALHKKLGGQFKPRDRVIYLGNVLGVGPAVRDTVDELVAFRRRLLARHAGAIETRDIVYLRGAQEEMWSKLLQLQFAPNPGEILDWLLDHGVGATITAYGGSLQSARGHCRDGAMAITKFTNRLRTAIHRAPGHYPWFTGLKRAAISHGNRLLFVHASIDPARPLTMQGDSFWWDNGAFDQLNAPFESFTRIVRGYDHRHRGVDLSRPHALTVDGGCGYGGGLTAVAFGPGGEILDRIDV